MNRREFLAASGGLSVLFAGGCALPVIPKRPKPELLDATSWVRFAGGRYSLHIPRVEMGQNILTALKQIACEELGVGFDAVDARSHSTDRITRVRATVGSDSIKDFALPLAQACATLRQAIERGERSGVLEAKGIPAAELRAFAKQTKFVGKAVAVEQAIDIVRGRAVFASDVQRPNLAFGRVLRAPVSPEIRSRVKSLNEAAASAVPGFIALSREPLLAQMNSEGVGIVGATPAALNRIEAALAIAWQTEGNFEQADIDAVIDIDTRLGRGALSNKVHKDSVDTGAPWDVDLRIDIPLAAHAPIEPRAAVAEFSSKDKLSLWVGSQDVFYQRDVVAKLLGLAEDNVVAHGQRVGGGFGGKTICTVELEAAVLARACKRPVKVQWTRAQEFRYGFHRPPTSHRIRARLKDREIDTWWHGFASGHILFTNAALPPWIQTVTKVIGDDGVARGSVLPYRATRKRTEFDLARLPVFTGPWRGLGAAANVFALESAIDECARVASIDALQFRITQCEDARLRRVLERVANAADWHAKRPSEARVQRGRGVAGGIYKAMSYAAVVADVTVDHELQTIRVDMLWCAHDCGRVINPDQVRAQCEGNLVWGLGMVLRERLPVANSVVSALTFLDSPIPRMSDVPPMQIVLVDEGDASSGAGETAIVASGAAIANAIRDACGVRPQRLPLSYADLQRQS